MQMYLFYGSDILIVTRMHLGCVLRVNGPVFPDDPSPGGAVDSEFFRLEPSRFSNGCFIARLSRQVRAEGEAGGRR